MAEVLTPQQHEAVTNRGGKLLVSAAAGSGKTKVLVDRLLSYLTDPVKPANIDDFLIITYTKMAASELRAKIAAKLSERIAENPGNRHLHQQMQRLYLSKISTVHAFCTDLLREYAYMTDVPADFSVADENECTELQMLAMDHVLEEAYAISYEDEDLQSFFNSQGFGRDDRQIPEIIMKVYNSARCHLDPLGWLDWCVRCTDVPDGTDASEMVFGRYLMEDLRQYLQLQIDALQKCANAAEAAFEMEKPAALLSATVAQLKVLADSSTWDDVIKNKDIDFGRLIFSKKCTDFELVDRIKAVRSACKVGLEKKLRSFTTSNYQVLEDLRSSAATARGLSKLVSRFMMEYNRRKKVRRILDFGDLEHKTLDLLLGKKRSGPTALAAEIGARYCEIMVDEYQDSNGVQDAIFGALTEKRNNCFMVGDVKQSIYQFRLADPGIFLEKYNLYESAEYAEPGEGRKVLLSSNFRSSNGILQGVNDVFTYCMSPEVGGLAYDEAERLREGVPHVSISEPEVELYGIDVHEDTYAEEAAFAAMKIRSLLDGTHMVRNGNELRPIRPEDIVILLRSPGSVGGEFVYALGKQGIRCATDNSTDLLQTEEIILLRSFLQIISNPLQDIPLISVLTSRIFAFTANDLAKIRSGHRRCSFYESLKDQQDDKCRKFLDLLQILRNDARLYSLSQLLQQILIRTSMDSIFAAMDDGLEKRENIYSFCQLAADFESGGRKQLVQFLDYLDILADKGLSRAGDSQNTGSVTIMSIHKSKGLEFPVVFLCGLSRMFNLENSRAQVLCDKELGLGLNCVDIKNRVSYPTIAKKAIASKVIRDSISEEMRVLYVAMTRARDRLIMTYAAKNIEKDLSEIASRLDLSGSLLMTSGVSCPGDWILQAAMQRTEAGAFFAIAGRPDCVSLRETVWGIHLVEGLVGDIETLEENEDVQTLPSAYIDTLRSSLAFQYPHIAATLMSSKQTATQLKGRLKDHEAAENAKDERLAFYNFRKPAFVETVNSSREQGTAVHAVMQFIRFDACTDQHAISLEIDRLVQETMISKEQAAMVDCRKIAALFTSTLGRKLQCHKNTIREFKFSILDDGNFYDRDLEGEQVLLQGVVDCAMIDADGIIVIDFKTDKVTEDKIGDIIHKYSPQINIYARALERIYQRPVKEKFIYLFELDQFVAID